MPPFSPKTRRAGRLSWPRRRAAAVLGAAALLATPACSEGVTASADQAEGRPTVLAAFYPLEWISVKAGGQDAAVTGLTQPGVEPHDLELTPRQIADIERADLIVYIKGVQPAVDEAVMEHAAGKAFDAASVVATVPSTAEQRSTGDGVSYDPHLWLDPSRLATVVAKLGERLAAIDRAHAAGYASRAGTAAGELNALDAEFRRTLAGCATRTLVTSHTAFGYLAERYNLRQVGISGLDPEAEPDPARLARVAATAREEGVTTIFTEELVSPKVAEVLAGEVGAKTAVLNPIESRPAQGDYLSAARANLSALRTALGCP
ncbi:metal ABC transporter substrate-binding protein [Sphaerisporangium siamense]|uniref:Zinc transport system substrate-binding protein n=1 Tax=Sphaerisporangium siamense TaxID=795645 RepID=A0A7W7GDQ3_9ACTN|nr:metal ABC transporter substrate-binding protein [Sphaerisporangium siamense]MBB4705220.1 zinc transport system substrate-binding protein [Sphaerisporangium siamense]